jgi:hypothetical protein
MDDAKHMALLFFVDHLVQKMVFEQFMILVANLVQEGFHLKCVKQLAQHRKD